LRVGFLETGAAKPDRSGVVSRDAVYQDVATWPCLFRCSDLERRSHDSLSVRIDLERGNSKSRVVTAITVEAVEDSAAIQDEDLFALKENLPSHLAHDRVFVAGLGRETKQNVKRGGRKRQERLQVLVHGRILSYRIPTDLVKGKESRAAQRLMDAASIRGGLSENGSPGEFVGLWGVTNCPGTNLPKGVPHDPSGGPRLASSRSPRTGRAPACAYRRSPRSGGSAR